MRARPIRKTMPEINEPPLLGSIWPFYRDRLELFTHLAKACPEIGAFHFGPKAIAFVSSAECTGEILIKHEELFTKGILQRKAVSPIIGNGLFISEGEYHREQRRLIAPVFQARALAPFAGIVTSATDELQSEWKDGSVLELTTQMQRLILSIMGRVLLGSDLYRDAENLGRAITTCFEYFAHAASRPLSLPLSWPTRRNLQTREALNVINQEIQHIVRDRKASKNKGNDILSALLGIRDRAGYPLRDEQIRDELMTILLAGYETTVNAVCWCIYMLMTHLDVLERLLSEVRTQLGYRVPMYEDLVHFPFTLQVLKETLRLYPPGYVLGRKALETVVVGGHTLEKGRPVLLCPYTLHRNPHYYAAPDEFDPNRFSTEAERSIRRSAYIPFGAGSRVCLGKYFALMEIQLILATLLQRVDFVPIPEQVVYPSPKFTLHLKSGYRVRVHRRT